MGFDLRNITNQLAAMPLTSPYSHELSVAIICDTFRMGNVAPPTPERWSELESRFRHALWKEQVAILAHVLTASTLREKTAATLKPGFDAKAALTRFFDEVTPLSSEMVRSNTFRQEEFLRKWIRAVGGHLEGEADYDSEKRIEQLDYRKALREMAKAEEARKEEAKKREQMLKEAAQRATDARGWRE